MAIALYDSLDTPNAPGLQFPTLSLSFTNVNQSGGQMFIPMTVTSFTPPSKKSKVNQLTTGYLSGGNNLIFGGTTASFASDELPKMSVEGFIDTPTAASGDYQLVTTTVNGLRMYLAEVISMYWEGRASSPTWQIVNPLWFRDPIGRVYNNPTILDFSASYIEAIPGRTNFSMQLKI